MKKACLLTIAALLCCFVKSQHHSSPPSSGHRGATFTVIAYNIENAFATKLQNAGKDVNFLLAWNRPHSGDYSLDELFLWIADIVKK